MAPENELNEVFEEELDEATVITVPIDTTLQNSGEAADAKAVGDALALKADISSVVQINVNGQEPDNQGNIIVDGTDVKMSSTDTRTLKAAIDSAAARTGADIPLTGEVGAPTIAQSVAAAGTMNATTIPMSGDEGADMIAEKIGEMDGVIGGHTTDIAALQAKAGDTILLAAGGDKTIKAAVEERVKTVNGESPDAAGAMQINSVALADNLNSTLNKTSSGEFVFRTSGGESSIQSGDAWLNVLKGEMEHDGYSPLVVEMQVNSTGCTAVIDEDDFIAEMVSDTGTMTFSYTTDWDSDPAEYGITVTGSPTNGDTIVVVYAKEVRGTITMSDPQTFVSTGWNLYNHGATYAKVKKYSEEYGFRISGDYTQIKYSETLTGEKSSIAVTNGRFTVPADGYVWVTGGNSTNTAIWMTWEDWTAEANGGVFEPYEATVIDLSSLMGTRFPNGLMKAGSYQDEINLATGKAYSRVDRIAYSAANLALVKSYGRDYVYDENYIYYGKESQVPYDITLENAYKANDHGEEYFTGTDTAPFAQLMYGINLRNKLERDVATLSQQDLTPAQQAQVRENIGAAGADDLGSLFLYKTYTASYSNLASKASRNLTVEDFGITRPSGYVAFGFYLRFSSGNTYVAVVQCNLYASAGSTVMTINNLSDSAKSGTATIGFMWIKSGFMKELTT